MVVEARQSGLDAKLIASMLEAGVKQLKTSLKELRRSQSCGAIVVAAVAAAAAAAAAPVAAAAPAAAPAAAAAAAVATAPPLWNCGAVALLVPRCCFVFVSRYCHAMVLELPC